MKKRFWAAVGVGAIVGASGVLGFGPLVRAQAESKAAAYGATINIQHVVPGWNGVHLKGVDVALNDVDGVRVWVDDVVVGWNRRPKSINGGRVTAVGDISGLASDLEEWRSKHLSKRTVTTPDKSSTSSGLALAGFDVRWSDAREHPRQTVHATDVSMARVDGEFKLQSSKTDVVVGKTTLTVDAGRIAVKRTDNRWRLSELASDSLVLRQVVEAKHLAPATSNSPSSEAPTAAPSAASSTNLPAAPHRRVENARRGMQLLRSLAERVDSLLDEEALVAVRGARAELTIAGSPLNLGPGTLRVRREQGRLVVALEPDVSAAAEKPLTFALRVPIGAAADQPLEGQLVGGPVWLNLLGIREGDLGLQEVARTSVESDVRLTLPADGKSLKLSGRGKLHKLSLDNKRLATQPLRDMEIAWRTKLEAQLDGSEVILKEAEVDVGALRVLFSGKYTRHAKGHNVNLDFELPLVSCQSVLEALPKGLTSRIANMRLVGSLAAKGHARFDTAAINKKYDVDWDGTNSCRVVEAPPELDVKRFKSSFVKTVYTPEGRPTKMTFGPNTKDWTPLSGTSHFMEGAVLTCEDGRFFRHNGFDQEAIVNSIQQNIEAGRFVRGASTISMQLAKNLYLPRTKTIARKLQEAVLTMYLEQALTKAEMMELYLNVIEYGPMIYGIGPAARHYFNTHPGRLSLGQSLYLGSILSAPKKQYFGAGGAVTAGRMRYLKRLMKIVHKIGRASEEELELGLRETVIFGSPSPALEPAEDDSIYPDDEPADGGAAQQDAPRDGSVDIRVDGQRVP